MAEPQVNPNDPQVKAANPPGTQNTADPTQESLEEKPLGENEGFARKGTWYAHTDLVWSNVEIVDDVNVGGPRRHVGVGEEVDVSQMSDEVFDTFVEAGAILTVPRIDIISEEDTAQLIADQNERIAELEAALAEAKKSGKK